MKHADIHIWYARNLFSFQVTAHCYTSYHLISYRVGNVPMDPEKVEIMDNGVIMFKQITSAQQGSYLCTATNDMGTITATASLIVEGMS